jgi:hypothetical protein
MLIRVIRGFITRVKHWQSLDLNSTLLEIQEAE